ncbi:MAG: hypothetical protein ACJ74M_09805 [Gaiellaceae bacterium]|jgi:uncharacterized protein
MAVPETLASKAAGHRPGRVRAAIAAAAVGTGAAVLTYRVLRSEGGGEASP